MTSSLPDYVAGINPSDVRNDKLRRAIVSAQEMSRNFMFNYSDYSDYNVQYHVAQSK